MAVCVMMVVGIMLTSSYVFSAQNAFVLKIDGEVIATVVSAQEAQTVIDQLVNQQNELIGETVWLSQEITLTKTALIEDKPVNSEQLRQRLLPMLTYQLDGAVVRVNNVPLLTFSSVDTAEQFLANLKEQYQIMPDGKLAFLEDVQVLEATVLSCRVILPKDALAKVKESTLVEQHLVKAGENPWDIATNHDISVERLQELNPSLKPESVQIGQVINLSDRQPLINVIHTFEEVVAEKIKAPLQVKRDDKMLKGHSKIVQPGADGLKEVKYKIITKNGVETEQVVLSENIIKEPVARIEQKGTRMLVASRNFGGGRLAKPSEGVVVSPFGMRRGRMHTGVDFGASHGSAVVAAEAGRVIRAGWFGGYGLCVDISHGNGMVTRYAHLSNIKVSVGNNVQRTQVIGAVGNTGNSTGPHLHFEVLKNGSPQNPLNYL